jgi:hypothetical protein
MLDWAQARLSREPRVAGQASARWASGVRVEGGVGRLTVSARAPRVAGLERLAGGTVGADRGGNDRSDGGGRGVARIRVGSGLQLIPSMVPSPERAGRRARSGRGPA